MLEVYCESVAEKLFLRNVNPGHVILSLRIKVKDEYFPTTSLDIKTKINEEKQTYFFLNIAG